jgi:two-component system, chemotaxis family, CheB/CheR fusion protein
MAGEPRRIVVADDDSEVRRLLREYLEGCGFGVLEAQNGLEALLHVKREHPAAVVLDVHMPRLGGVDALRRIRSFDPSIVIAVVTGDEDPELHRRIVAEGAAAVFMKPVALPALAATLTLVARGTSPAPGATRPPLETPPAAPRPAAAARASVLVVDDEDIVRDLLLDFLQPLGYQVQVAADAVTALRRLGQAAVDLVLLDVEMPGLNGLAALPSIRALAPEAAIVIVSGVTDATLASLAMAHGAFDYLTKPIDFPRLAKTLETALAVRRVQA